MRHCKNCNIYFSDILGGCPSCCTAFSSTSVTSCLHKQTTFIREYEDPHYQCNDCGMRLGSKLFMENVPMVEFQTKDSGKRQEFETGMVRDTQDDKPRYDLLDLPMLKRWAELMARGAEKYGENNWRKASTQIELDRFTSSAVRHMFQWLEGDKTEDHGAAVYFNIAGAEMVKDKLMSSKQHNKPDIVADIIGDMLETRDKLRNWDLRQG